jgi:hypothetical protein
MRRTLFQLWSGAHATVLAWTRDELGQHILHRASRVFPAPGEKSDAPVETPDISPVHMLRASADTYAKRYSELARRAAPGDIPDELTLRALEDVVIASGLLIDSADTYYYREFTPQLERDAQRAEELQAELLGHKRRGIWARR